MSTSDKSDATIRQGGPGAAHENAKAPKDPKKPPADPQNRRTRSKTSGGGGEQDRHHTHDPEKRS